MKPCGVLLGGIYAMRDEEVSEDDLAALGWWDSLEAIATVQFQRLVVKLDALTADFIGRGQYLPAPLERWRRARFAERVTTTGRTK